MKAARIALVASLLLVIQPVQQVQGQNNAGKPAGVSVEVFNPQGEVKNVRQVTARFSEAMVAFGDPRLDSPFQIQCDAKGRGRWVDARSWVYDFERDLPGGMKCSFTLKTGLRSQPGNPVAAQTFSFMTGGPAILTTVPSEGSETVDEDQVFLLGLDAPANLATVKEKAYCSIEGVGERIPLTVLEGSQRDAILKEQSDRILNFFQVLTKRGQQGMLAVKDKRFNDLNVVAARCGRKLPAGAKVNLRWGKGIATPTGIATSQDQTLQFMVREAFTSRMTCTRINANAGCVPVTPVVLWFTAPVPRELAAKISLRNGDGSKVAASFDGDNDKSPVVESVTFKGPFKASSEARIELPPNFRDDNGRVLENAASFPLKINIDDDPPLIKFPSKFGILELNADPALPVSVRNVEATLKGTQVQLPASASTAANAGKGNIARLNTQDDAELAKWFYAVSGHPVFDSSVTKNFYATYNRYPAEGEIPLLLNNPEIRKSFQSTPIDLPRSHGDKQFELIGIPFKKPGFYIVELASDRLGVALHEAKNPYYVASSALVTNMAVHLKKGRESSLVWVTRLDNAQPVSGAAIRVSGCDGKSLWEGSTDANGMAHIAKELPESHSNHCYGYFVTARKDDDMSFMVSNWSDGISPWQFNLGGGGGVGPVIAHTVFDRPLFRAGETVSMKHFVRMHTTKGLSAVNDLNSSIVISHEGSGQTFDVPVNWANGTGISTWQIPKEAKLGSYSVMLKKGPAMLPSGSFRVEQYRVPLMRAVLKPPAQPVVNVNRLDIDAQLNLMAGGAAAGAPVKFRSRVVSYPLRFPKYDDFSFGGQMPKEGIEAVQPYSYDPYSDNGDADGDGSDQQATGTDQNGDYPPRTQQATLDANGGTRVSFDKLPKVKDASALEVEMEYADPNGQIQTAATRALLLPSSVVLGIRMESFYADKDHARFKVIALTPDGKPLANQKISVDAYIRKTYAYRKRMLGGFYAYEQTVETKRAGSLCEGKTDNRGLLICDGSAPDTGELVIVAQSKDAQGNPGIATSNLYISGPEDWYSASQNDRIDLLPDQRSYEPGDKARFEVRMPFREATALVTIEREGVIDSFVTHISASSPYIEVPIAENYGPNAYVSVMVVRGRVDPQVPGPFAWLKRMMYQVGKFFGFVKEVPKDIDTRPTALVDLTKPAFKLGMTSIKVGWRGYELKVKVEPAKATFHPRDQVPVTISVTDASGKPAANGEIALAAVDEGLLQLAAPDSWNLLEAMMERRPIEVFTSTAQSQVIGKRHFGKKSTAPGGGGGQAANARELFDTLLTWNPRVHLDANGRAQVQVPLNDSLTAFRIVAIAHDGEARFGSGTAMINTTQDVMLFAGLPPFVREGDQFSAMLTVRNSSERPLTLDVSASADSGNGAQPVGTQRISLKPGEGNTVSFPASAPFDAKKLEWTLSARETGQPANVSPAKDSLKFTQTVGAAYPVRVYQQTIEQLNSGKPWAFPVQRPAGAIAGRGGIDIRLTSSLGNEMSSVREWALRYPFSCMEQRASVAVTLEDEDRWNRVMRSLPTHLDRDGLVRYFPMDWLEGDDALTAYLLTIADEAHYTIPDSSLQLMLKGLEDFVSGRIHRYGSLQTADVVMRKLAAIDALARYGHARPDMLEPLEIAPNLWPSSGVIDWASVLVHMKNVPDRDKKLQNALQILRSRLMYSGTLMSFSTEKQDYLWWLMVSPDLNAVRTLRLLTDDPQTSAADAGRLARGALARQTEGHWRTTLANAWGVVAMRSFRQKFERDPVAGSTIVKLADQERPLAWANARSAVTNDPTAGTPGGPVLTTSFGWPVASAPLALTHQGSGAPWTFVTARAALPLQKPLFAGYSIKRSVTPVEQKTSGSWQRGDSYRVTLEIDAQSDMTWVAVSDPVPAGASVLGNGLGGDSAQLTAGQKQTGWTRPAFEERAFDGYRAYYSYVPKGKFSVEYTVRLNNPGRFEMPSSRVEAMYAPEIFGELPVARMEVKAN